MTGIRPSSLRAIPSALLACLLLASCGARPSSALRIALSTGMEDLAPVLEDWGAARRLRLSLEYLGSLDMAAELSRGAPRWDAAWSQAGLWLSGIPSGRIGDLEPTMSSPIVWGLGPKAQALFGADKPLSTRDLAAAASAGKIRLLIPDPYRTGTGAAAVLLLVQSLSPAAGALDAAALSDRGLGPRLKSLMGGLSMASGGDESAAAAMESLGADAVALSESALIRWNETAPDGKKLRAAYPSDGCFLEDGPLARVIPAETGDASRKADRIVADLQAWLRSAEGREALTAAGRRAWLGGAIANPRPIVFDPAWGIRTDRELAVFRQPRPETAAIAISLFESARRPPVLAILCLDYSSSMKDGGKPAMIEALRAVLSPAPGALLPPPPFLGADRISFIPFAETVKEDHGPTAPRDPAFAAETLDAFADLPAKGSSGVFAAARRALSFAEANRGGGLEALIVMVGDGKDTEGKFGPLALDWKISLSKPPLSSVMLGESDNKQVKAMADLSGGRVLDGRRSIHGAFREAVTAR